MVANKVCLRCGTEISGLQDFCENCLSYTEGRPVHPGTPLLLPNRNAALPQRKRRGRRVKKPEEQIHSLKNIIAWLVVLISAVTVALVLSLMLNFQLLGVNPADIFSFDGLQELGLLP
jgi:hypothetical protein